MTARTLLGMSVAASLAACTVGPKYVPPLTVPPESLVRPNAPPVATPLSPVVEREADLSDWWSQFGDPTLTDLIMRALRGNLDRRTAASRLREARAAAAEARSALLPSVQGGADYYHARLGTNVIPSGLASSLGGSGGGTSMAGGSGASGGIPPIETDVYVLGLQGSYTVDLFGANRSAARAARERSEAQVWSARDTEVTVAAEVGRAYFSLRATQARLAVLQANVRAQTGLLDILVARARGGLVNQVDSARQSSQLALTKAEIAPAEAEAAADVHQLGLLLGVGPDVLADELAPRPDPIASTSRLPPLVPIGLPSSLLQRRPDVRQAERQLAASVSDVDRATAQLYPQIKLTGVADLVSSSLRQLLEWGSRTLLAGATATQPLFDGGGRLAQRREARERSTQAAFAYQKAVLSALAQTADALARYGADQRRLVVLRAGYAEARRAAELDRAQYAGGLTDLTSTIQADATALQTQDQLAQAEGQALSDLIDLYRSLGGGWDSATDASRDQTGSSGGSASTEGGRLGVHRRG